MKKILTAIAGLLITGNAVADIHVTSVPEFSGDTLTVAYVSLNDVMTKSRKDLTPVVKEEIIRPDFTIATAGTEPMRFDLRFGNSRERFFANANDKINVQLNNDGSMIITGTPLLDQVADLRNKLQGPMQAYAKALETMTRLPPKPPMPPPTRFWPIMWPPILPSRVLYGPLCRWATRLCWNMHPVSAARPQPVFSTRCCKTR